MFDDILNYIRDFKKEHGHVPTKSNISEALTTTRQNIHYHFLQNDIALVKEFPEYKRYF